MKLFKIIPYVFFAAIAGMGCEKNTDSVLKVSNDESQAKLKVVYASAYLIRDSVQIKINDNRVSNTFISSSTTFLPTPFPGGGLNTGGASSPWYFSVKPGPTKIFVSVPKKLTTIDSIFRFSGIVNLEAGKYYSAYITDTLLNANVVLAEDNLDLPPDGFSRYKFVNLLPNLAAVDLYYKGVLVAGNIPYKGISPEFTLPYTSFGQWAIRPAGALPTTTATAVYPTGTATNVVPNRRVLTVFVKGYSGGTTSRSPIISLLFNR